jgi:D-galactose 1-dehydrogenase
MADDRDRISIGIVGFGKIAQTEHVPAIRLSDQLVLHSVADQASIDAPVPRYRDVESMLAAADAPEAVAICTPPQARYRIAQYALTRGKHVLLEKPPCARISEAEDLLGLAKDTGKTLFCAWHSRFAPAVKPALEWLAARTVRAIRIVWHEDVRVWHPGQTWIWKQGGCGVFDAGINALSIVTAIFPLPFALRDAQLRIPANCDTPIAAELAFTNAAGFDTTASLNWLHEGRQTWEIEIDTNDGRLVLSEGGGRLDIDGRPVTLEPSEEYRHVYARFEHLISAARCDADLVPFHLVEQALEHGKREPAPAFSERATAR